MSPEPKTDASAGHDIEGDTLSDRDLAQTWLTRETDAASRRLGNVTRSFDFYERYNPSPLGPRPADIEPGGSDASDWEAEELAYRQWPDERDEMIDHLDNERTVVEDKIADLFDFRTRLEEGNPEVITRLAALERARMEALKEQERLARERKVGVAFEGVSDAVRDLQVLSEMQRAGTFPQGGTGTGWQRIYDSGEGYMYVYQLGKGPLGGYTTSISIGRDPLARDDDNVINVRYRDLSQMNTDKTASGTRVYNQGLGLFFKVDPTSAIVRDHFTTGMRSGLQFGDHGTLEIKSDGEAAEMTQAHFDNFRTHLGSLVGSAQSPASSNPS